MELLVGHVTAALRAAWPRHCHVILVFPLEIGSDFSGVTHCDEANGRSHHCGSSGLVA